MTGYIQYDSSAKNYLSLGEKLAKLVPAPDCVLISALPQDNAAAVTDAVARALPGAQLFATASLAESSYVDPASGRGRQVRRPAPDDHRRDPVDRFAAARRPPLPARLRAPVRRLAAGRDLRPGGDGAHAPRDLGRQRRRHHSRSAAPPSPAPCSPPTTSRACSAPIRSTARATPRCAATASTACAVAGWCSGGRCAAERPTRRGGGPADAHKARRRAGGPRPPNRDGGPPTGGPGRAGWFQARTGAPAGACSC